MIAPIILLALSFAPAQTGASQQTASSQQASRSYRISGAIVDSITGTPVRRADVTISATSGDGEDETIRTTDGTFSFDGVQPNRKYRLFAAAPGYISEGYDQHQGFYSAIAVGDAFDSEHIVFRLRPQAVIYGTVTDEHGEPVRHAGVMLVSFARGGRTPSVDQVQQTNDLGEYRISRLSPGNYIVMVQASPWYAQSGFKFVPQVQVSEASVSTNDSGSVSTNDNASVSLNEGSSLSVVEGPITPRLDPALDVVYPTTFYPSVTDAHDAEEIQIAAGEKREADIALAPVPAAHIRVTNVPVANNSATGNNSVFVSFQVQQSIFGVPVTGGSVASAYIGPGEYEISGVPAGNATLTINQFGTEHRTTETLQANFSAATIDASTAVSAANISGQVIFAGDPPPSIQGSVFLSNGQRTSYSARLRKDGTFSFDSSQLLVPGTYHVGISLNNGRGENYVQHVSATGANVTGRDIIIESGATVQFTVTVGKGLGQISGVAQLDGKPASGAMVLLIPESGQDIEDDYREDQSDTDGSFTLGRIIPGKYLLMAIQDGWDLGWRDPQVLAPFREKAQHIEVGPGQEQKVTLVALSASSRPAPQSQPTH